MDMDGEAAAKKYSRFGKIQFQRPSRRCIYIIVAVGVLCILCIVLATTLSRKSKDYCPDGVHCDWRSMNPSEFLKDDRCKSVCTTKPCIRSAQFSLKRIDATKDPCDDFYDFACGKFEEEAVLHPGVSEAALTYHEIENELLLQLKDIMDSVPEKAAGVFSDTLLLARKLYDDCMNTDSHPDSLKRNGMGILVGQDGVLPWPLLNRSLSNDADQLARIMSSSIFYDGNPFFSLAAVSEKGREGTEDQTLIFHFEDFGRPPTNPSEEEVEDKTIYPQYASVIDKVLYESGVNANDVPKVSSEIMQFEKKLAAAVTKALNAVEEKSPDYYSIPRIENFDCRGLENRMKRMKWCKIVENLLQETGRPTGIKVELRFPEDLSYLDAVNKVISHEEDRVVINYVVAKFIIDHLKYMPASLRQLYYQYPEVFPRDNVYRLVPYRWQQCTDMTANFFPITLEYEYMNKKLLPADMNKATFIVEKMREECVSAVGKMTWIDQKMREKLKSEVQQMGLSFGNSGYLKGDQGERVDEVIGNITRIAHSSLLKTSKLSFIEDALEMKKLIRKVTPGSASLELWKREGPFRIFPHQMELYLIRLFYGMLQFPMFLPFRPMYVEFAMLGKNLLHSMSNSYILNNLSENTTKIMQPSLKCLDDQVRSHRAGKPASKAEERNRMYENFHNTWTSLASSEAYMKYLKENGEEQGLPGLPLSNEQLFFLSLAQINCENFKAGSYKNYPSDYFTPSKVRVNMPLANSELFSKAFRCPSGSKMNPEKKCCIIGDGKLSEKC